MTKSPVHQHNAVNYQKQMEEIIAQQKEGQVPTLLLHSCCAPCSSHVLSVLSPHFEIIDYFYNPNISPRKEYEHRAKELEGLISAMKLPNPVHFVEGVYDPERFFTAVHGYENEPERGARCEICFELRLFDAARIAAEQGADYFTTSLTISPMKDAALLNEIGQKAGETYGVAWLPSDFKKKGGYQHSIELSREYDLYRQDYCGCIFSKQQREREKDSKCDKRKE